MSEFLAEAQVLVRPNTAAFRAQLLAQLAVATKGVTVPVNIVAGGTGVGSAAAATGQLAAAQAALNSQMAALRLTLQSLTGNLVGNTAALEANAVAAAQAAGAQAVQDRAMRTATGGLAQFRKGIIASLASLTGLRGAVLAASAPFLVAAVSAAAFLKSLQAFAEFERQLNVFAVTAAATTDQMQEISDLARELGADVTLPGVAAADAAAALTELARAGLSVEDAMGGVRGVLQLSTAAQISAGEAAQFAANELNAFGLAGDQAVRVADVLANAANEAQGSISDFGLAFKQSAAVANQVGLSLEETAAQLTILARAGLQGSDAGTSLRVALLRLINPTKEAAAIIKRLGIELRDSQGNIRSDVFVQFGEATANFTPKMRDAAFAAVFGADAIRTVAIAAKGGRDALAEATLAIGEQGTAARLAEAQTAGFGGQLETLKNTSAEAALSLGEVSTVIAGPLVFSLTVVAFALNSVLRPFADVIALAKEKIGITFDPAVKSSAELITKLNEVRETYGKLGDVPAVRERINEATQDAIRALENERAVLKALGVDSSAVTALIKNLRNEQVALGSSSVITATALQKSAKNVRDLIAAASPGEDTSGLRRLLSDIQELIAQAGRASIKINDLPDGIIRVGDASNTAAAGVNALTKAMKGLTQESTTLSDQLQKAVAEGATPQTQIGLLQQSNATQRAIIANAEKDGRTAGDITTIRKARAIIIANNAEIESLQNEITTSTKALATSAEKAQKERQDAFERVLAAQLLPKERLLTRAGGTEGLGDDIKFREIIIKILQGQIALIRKTLGNTQEARALINAIQDRILDEVNKLKKDQADFRQQLRAALEEKLERAQRGTELDIELADINENTKRRIALRQRLIAQLKKEARTLNLQGNALKEQRNEIARIRAEIKAIQEESKGAAVDANNTLSFEFLQKMEGFSANLLGNLIPGFAAAGLVGGSQARAPENLVSPAQAMQAQAGAGKITGPTFGQAATEVDILKEVLRVLKAIHSGRAAPEAGFQRDQMSAVMDGSGGGGGGQTVS